MGDQWVAQYVTERQKLLLDVQGSRHSLFQSRVLHKLKHGWPMSGSICHQRQKLLLDVQGRIFPSFLSDRALFGNWCLSTGTSRYLKPSTFSTFCRWGSNVCAPLPSPECADLSTHTITVVAMEWLRKKRRNKKRKAPEDSVGNQRGGEGTDCSP